MDLNAIYFCRDSSVSQLDEAIGMPLVAYTCFVNLVDSTLDHHSFITIKLDGGKGSSV